jgi:hypothetical protein
MALTTSDRGKKKLYYYEMSQRASNPKDHFGGRIILRRILDGLGFVWIGLI